ncbi:MAG: hypothetical protein ISS48_00075 [Candidatus Aenigmarchaeota archaeon]|nr:hypothetical protein [Candidatus Aenigmarchaeota archaeon]
MSAIQIINNFLHGQGIFEFYLPFLLTFSIFYALLFKSQIFGRDKPGPAICIIVALIAGIYIMRFSAVGAGVSLFFMQFFAQASVFLTLIMVIAMVLGALAIPVILGKDSISTLFAGNTAKLILGIVVILIVLAMFSSNFIALPGFPGFSLPSLGLSGDDIAVILLLGVTGIVIWLATREGGLRLTKAEKAKVGGEREAARKKPPV